MTAEVAAVDRSDPAKNRYRQLPTASALGSVLVRHSLAAGGCWPRVTRENDGSGSSLLWVAVKRYSHHAFQAYLKATRSAGGFFTYGFNSASTMAKPLGNDLAVKERTRC